MSIRFQTPKIRRLYELLQGALLIDKDRKFAKGLIQMLEAAPINATTRAAYSGLKLLLDQDNITRAKTTRRFAATKIDIFKQNLHRFTDKEMAVIVRACHLIQMTDGCTVACSWCYLNAQPYIQYAISFDSARRFIKKYVRLLPDPTRLYWASDPLDWYDGERSYVDLVDEFYKAAGNKKSMVTTTSLPMGTEFTLLRLIQWFDTNLPFKQSQSFTDDRQHYLKDNVMKGLFYQKNRTYDIHSLFDYYIKKLFYDQKTRHVLKISETEVNYKRLSALFDILKFIGISQSCLSWIEVETRDVKNFDGVRKSGRAYTWENRDIILDSVSMACWDSTILFPGKVGAMEMCGVTSATQRGLEFWLIDPGKQKIPQARVVERSECFPNDGGRKKYLLPHLEMIEYSQGVISNRWIHYSLTRDIQTYGLLLSKTLPLVEFIAKQTHKQLNEFGPWQEIQKQYKERRAMSDKLLRREKEEKVIQVIRYLTKHIERKLQL
jgi:hypothetical protein